VATVIVGFLVTGSASAQVVISSGTTGPISGAGSSVTVTLSGTVQGIGDPGVISAPSGSETTSLVNTGQILASGYLGLGDGYAVWSNGATIGSITNNGRIDGEARGVSIDNDGVSGVTTLTNNAGGIINGGLQMAVYNGNVLGTLTNSGTIQGADGIYSLVSTGTIDNQAGGWIQGGKAIWIDGGTAGAISNAGTVYGGRGLSVSAGAGVATVTNSGAFLGVGDFAVFSSGTLGMLTNSGTFSGTGGIASLAGIDSLTNQAGGRIEGSSVEGVYLSGSAGVLVNAAGATITGAGSGGVRVDANGTLTLLANAGEIGNTAASSGWGVFNEHEITSLVNSGTISTASVNGGGVASFTQMDSLTNQAGGLIEGVNGSGVFVLVGTMNTLTNAGTISGANAGVITDSNSPATIGTLTNTGVITSGFVGIDNGHGIDTLTNSGLIQGAAAAIFNRGAIVTLTNSGTLAYAGSGAGPAILNEGILGDQSGTSLAIRSTASAALIAGSIVNNGTVFGGFSIAHQDVEVSAGRRGGSFVGGTLEVLDGNLTLAAGGGGVTVLKSNVAVNGGAGTFVNNGALALYDTRQVNGSFLQSAGGSFISVLDGASSGQYGQLVVGDAATFDGTLSIFQGTLSLAPGQSFELFDFASASGDFSSLEVDFVPATSLGGGVWSYGSLLLTEIWTGTSLSLSVSASAVPEIDPASFGSALALVLGSLGMLERRRRRLVRRTS
jgi:hypothetical protein